MKSTVVGALSFAVAASSPALALSLAALFSGSGQRANAFDDFLLVLYLLAVSASLGAIGYLIPTAASARWRRLTAGRAALISGALGLIAPLVALLVAALAAPAVLPLFRVARWLAVAILHGVPGLVLGAVAVLIAKASRRGASQPR